MRPIYLPILWLGLWLLLATSGSGQEPGARDMWIKSRTSVAESASKPRQKAPVAPAAPKKTELTLGLGYTLFLKNEADDDLRANPKQTFRSGNQVRLLVESNRNGYLYIFHQENGGPPTMLFPDWRVQAGDNRVRSHQPLWVPNRGVIAFDQHPAVERLVLVVTQDPISGLPIGEELKDREKFPVPAALFQQLSQPTPSREDTQLREGAKLTEREGRGVTLQLDDPAPAFVLVNRNPQERRIVVSLELAHR